MTIFNDFFLAALLICSTLFLTTQVIFCLPICVPPQRSAFKRPP